MSECKVQTCLGLPNSFYYSYKTAFLFHLIHFDKLCLIAFVRAWLDRLWKNGIRANIWGTVKTNVFICLEKAREGKSR